MTCTSGIFVRELDTLLTSSAEPKTKLWWERYMRGKARFRGVKMADTRAAVTELALNLDLDSLSVEDNIEIARACMREPYTEDKLAGVLLLAEHCLGRLRLEHTSLLAAPLHDGDLADWNTVDWYCVKTLGPFVIEGSNIEQRATAIADWRHAEVLWQRRAAAVTFVYHAGLPNELYPGFHRLLLKIAGSNAADPARWSQTSVGWVLRELSRHHPQLVIQFLATHSDLTREARKNATKYMAPTT